MLESEPPYPAHIPMLWSAGFNFGLVILAYVGLLVWISFGVAECPKK